MTELGGLTASEADSLTDALGQRREIPDGAFAPAQSVLPFSTMISS